MDKETFVKEWAKAREDNLNQTDLAERLGVTRQYVSLLAHQLRQQGVNLPRLNSTNVEKLNRILSNE